LLSFLYIAAQNNIIIQVKQNVTAANEFRKYFVLFYGKFLTTEINAIRPILVTTNGTLIWISIYGAIGGW